MNKKNTLMFLVLMLVMLLWAPPMPMAQEAATTTTLELMEIPEVEALKIEKLRLEAELLSARLTMLRIAIRQNQDQQAAAIIRMWKSLGIPDPENWEVDLPSRKARKKKSPPPE